MVPVPRRRHSLLQLRLAMILSGWAGDRGEVGYDAPRVAPGGVAGGGAFADLHIDVGTLFTGID